MLKIVVAVRFRPLTALEKSYPDTPRQLQSKSSENGWKILYFPQPSIHNNQTNTNYFFDHVFSDTSSNQEIFDSLVLPVLPLVIQGKNLTIFAYGQTSSGKTFTMRGRSENPGIIPLTISSIFNLSAPQRENYNIFVSYLECYNEQINDLLDDSKSGLVIRDDGSGQLGIEGLTEVEVSDCEEALKCFEMGEGLRKVGDNSRNVESSRSHTVFRMKIKLRTEEKIVFSELNLVDLAGSEGVIRAAGVEIRNREGSNINKSLLALSTLFDRLSDMQSKKNKKVHLNCRDSKLTRILQNSFLGNSNVILICNATPAAWQQQETINTLNFGTKAKRIKISAQVNEIINQELDPKRDQMLIKELREQIFNANKENSIILEANAELKRENKELKDAIKEKTKIFERINSDQNNACYNGLESNRTIHYLEAEILEKDRAVEGLKYELNDLSTKYWNRYKESIDEGKFSENLTEKGDGNKENSVKLNKNKQEFFKNLFKEEKKRTNELSIENESLRNKYRSLLDNDSFLSDYIKENNHLKQRIELIASENRILQVQQMKNLEQISELNNNIKATKEECSMLKLENKELLDKLLLEYNQNNLDAAPGETVNKSEFDELFDRFSVVYSENEYHKKKYFTTQSSLNASEAAVRSLQSKLSAEEKKIKSLMSIQSALYSDDIKDKEISALQIKIATLEQDLNFANLTCAVKNESISHKELIHNKTPRQQFSKEAAFVDKGLLDLKDENSKLLDEIVQLKKKCANLQTSLKFKRNSMSIEGEELKEISQSEKKKLITERIELERICEEKSNEIKVLNEEVERMKGVLSQEKKRFKDTFESLKGVEHESISIKLQEEFRKVDESFYFERYD